MTQWKLEKGDKQTENGGSDVFLLYFQLQK